MAAYPPNQLVLSIASESLSDVLTTIADTSLDAAIDSGALNGIPVIGLATGALKAARDLREALLIRKLAVFLQEAGGMTLEERRTFEQKFASKEAQDDFGGALLTLIDRSEDMHKPRILGRLLVAYARGAFSQFEFMRLAKMVDRCYLEDLAILKSFECGLLLEDEIAAQCLAAQGFLQQVGIDGGDAAGNGGIVYKTTRYGQWLAEHGLDG